MTKQRGLGKGLGALLGEAAMQTAQPPSGAQLLPLCGNLSAYSYPTFLAKPRGS